MLAHRAQRNDIVFNNLSISPKKERLNIFCAMLFTLFSTLMIILRTCTWHYLPCMRNPVYSIVASVHVLFLEFSVITQLSFFRKFMEYFHRKLISDYRQSALDSQNQFWFNGHEFITD